MNQGFLTYSVQGREDDATNNGTPILDLRTPIRQRLKTAARILPFATLLTYSITTTSSTVPRLLLSSSPTYPPHPNSGLQRRHCQKLLTLSERNKFRVWCSRAQDDEACESWAHIENHLKQHVGNTTTRTHLFQKARGVDDWGSEKWEHIGNYIEHMGNRTRSALVPRKLDLHRVLECLSSLEEEEAVDLRLMDLWESSLARLLVEVSSAHEDSISLTWLS